MVKKKFKTEHWFRNFIVSLHSNSKQRQMNKK